MQKEYGGYLPFELTGEKDDRFSGYGQNNILRTNSAKAALWYVLEKRGIQKLYIPYYMCESVNRMLSETKIQVEQVFLDGELMPVLPVPEPGAAVMLVNYFGILDTQIQQRLDRYERVIVDNSHAFFSEPVLRPGVDYIYSCRKFFGVPDGGCAIGADIARELRPDTVADRFSYLVTSAEQGMNAAYEDKRRCDHSFRGRYRGMSGITRGMLGVIDYENVREIRRRNFGMLKKLLEPANTFPVRAESCPAYLYPFLAAHGGEELKRRLVSERIYVPTLWPALKDDKYKNTLENRLSGECVFLPVDQRYTEEDMRFLSERVKALIS